MKKTYIAPQVKEVKVRFENAILAGSDPAINSDYGGTQLSKEDEDIADILDWIE